MNNNTAQLPEECATFLQRFNISQETFEKTGLNWSVLQEIRAAHEATKQELLSAGEYVRSRLQSVPVVHSLKFRIKDADHLLEKIIRKKDERPELDFSVETYDIHITDLIGIRALHLFKHEWQAIHTFVLQTWALREKPLAYVRKGDQNEMAQAFEESGCTVKEHPFGYRSIHYLIETQPARTVRLVELQVRTIFEEGWAEIDHRVRYPRHSNSPNLAGFLTIFNRLAGAADEMGTFTQNLSTDIAKQNALAAENARQLQEKEDELRKAVSRLQISDAEKSKLEKQIAELRRAESPATVTLSGPIIPNISGQTSYYVDLRGNSVRSVFVDNGVCSMCKNTYPASTLDSSSLCFLCRAKTMTRGTFPES